MKKSMNVLMVAGLVVSGAAMAAPQYSREVEITKVVENSRLELPGALRLKAELADDAGSYRRIVCDQSAGGANGIGAQIKSDALTSDFESFAECQAAYSFIVETLANQQDSGVKAVVVEMGYPLVKSLKARF